VFHADGAALDPLVGIAARRANVAEIVMDDEKEPSVLDAVGDGSLYDRGDAVAMGKTAVRRDFLQGSFYPVSEELDAEIEDFALVLEVEIEDCPSDSATLGDLLEGRVLEAFFHENIEGFFEYFTLSFVMLDGN
jgi:hypothetical protein